jgi:hypothetical protein
MRVRAVLGALSLGMPFVPSLAGQPQAVATQQRLAPVAVPQGDGAPVLTDGAFTPGEWDDALVIPVAGKDVALHVKEYRGVVFVGVRGTRGIGPSELSLAGPGGPIRKLHVSYALYEVELPPEGPEPKPRMGLTSGWYANELRRDEEALARLKQEGKPPWAADYPADGLEFAIRRSKVPGAVWRLRLWASAFVDGRPGMVTYPSGAAERASDGWLELKLK